MADTRFRALALAATPVAAAGAIVALAILRHGFALPGYYSAARRLEAAIKKAIEKRSVVAACVGGRFRGRIAAAAAGVARRPDHGDERRSGGSGMMVRPRH
jgi:hypothetical protein